MYEDLIKKLREYSSVRKGEIAELTKEAADAILELCDLCVSQSKDCSEAIAKYLELWTKQLRWILVTERLPEKIGHYLVNIKCPRGKWIEICSFDGSEWESIDDYAEIATKWVTHWMPLPEPPKEEPT